jgi:glyoxylase-like metal-dependent hydrolase (beta-lactamase superfamily II)
MLGFRHTDIVPDILLSDGDVIRTDGLELKVIHTPGHTPGGICLKGKGLVFTGDTLFMMGIGRTDLPGGNARKLLDSIHGRLLVLPDETVIYPGHGPSSTIGEERRANPYLNGRYF